MLKTNCRLIIKLSAALVVIFLACQLLLKSPSPTPKITPGVWLKGDIHVHTALSADAKSALSKVITRGFDSFNLDYIAISNHLRDNSLANDGSPIPYKLYSDALANYQLPALAYFREHYPNKLLINSFEWDIPTHDHMNIGILDTKDIVNITRYFEYRFGHKNVESDFTPEQIQKFNTVRQNKTHQDAVSALEWLQKNYPYNSYAMINHPTRYAQSYNIKQLRELYDAAPDVLFLLEGMVGNQFNGERGDYSEKSLKGLLGGVDPYVAEVGGVWDALLGDGRHIWNMADSDHHFKTYAAYGSGYFPGEYAKTYLFVPKDKQHPLNTQKVSNKQWLKALKSGNSFAVYGDLIDALQFYILNDDQQATMGQTLVLTKPQKITISIRVKQPAHNNKEQVVGDGHYNGITPLLHHIDLIAGDVMPTPPSPNTPAYTLDINPTTRVIKTFTDKDWVKDDNGFYTMSVTVDVKHNQYFRLRGTNLGSHKGDLSLSGGPKRSKIIPIEMTNACDYFQKINQRNYNDLWFYSNPVFVSVKLKTP